MVIYKIPIYLWDNNVSSCTTLIFNLNFKTHYIKKPIKSQYVVMMSKNSSPNVTPYTHKDKQVSIGLNRA